NYRQKRAEERDAHRARERERKRLKLAVETKNEPFESQSRVTGSQQDRAINLQNQWIKFFLPGMQRNFPFIILVQGECCCCCKEKKPKKFPSENDMDPGEPEDLQGLNRTSFPVIIVYTLQVSWRKAWIPRKRNKLSPKCARISPRIHRH
ncbi:22322_t:CDS:2, partial [Rhizophagus irregularis]